MTKFKLGDKVRILDNTKILLGFDLTVGKVYEVNSSNPGRISITDDAGDELTILESEYPAVEKVKGEGEMSDGKIINKIKRNIFELGVSMQDAPYHGVTRDTIKGVRFAVGKILKDTGISEEDVISELSSREAD